MQLDLLTLSAPKNELPLTVDYSSRLPLYIGNDGLPNLLGYYSIHYGKYLSKSQYRSLSATQRLHYFPFYEKQLKVGNSFVNSRRNSFEIRIPKISDRNIDIYRMIYETFETLIDRRIIDCGMDNIDQIIYDYFKCKTLEIYKNFSGRYRWENITPEKFPKLQWHNQTKYLQGYDTRYDTIKVYNVSMKESKRAYHNKHDIYKIEYTDQPRCKLTELTDTLTLHLPKIQKTIDRVLDAIS